MIARFTRCRPSLFSIQTAPFLLHQTAEVLGIAVLPQTVFAELDAQTALILAPVAPEQAADSHIAVDLNADGIRTATLTVQVKQVIQFCPVLESIDGKHGQVHMRVLHPGVLPVDQLQALFFLPRRCTEEEIVAYSIDMRQAALLLLCVQPGLQR